LLATRVDGAEEGIVAKCGGEGAMDPYSNTEIQERRRRKRMMKKDCNCMV
jgi:hypothetical protein